MASGQIQFYTEDIEFELTDSEAVSQWILETIKTEGFELDNIDYVFCSDEYLLQMNMQYLEHDTYTDILTFDYSEDNQLNADIYISVDRVRENAHSFGSSFDWELRRVIIHGILHLLGYVDKTDADRDFMRLKEDHYLSHYKA